MDSIMVLISYFRIQLLLS